MSEKSTLESVYADYQAAASLPMLTPVIIACNQQIAGIGTWCHIFGGLNTVVTCMHIFGEHKGEGVWIARPLSNLKHELVLREPQIVPKIGTNDVVRCDIVSAAEAKAFSGPWTHGYVIQTGRERLLLRPIRIKSLISGACLELTHEADSPHGKMLFSMIQPQYGPGESGSGFVSDTGELHVNLAGSHEEKRYLFSRDVRFSHQKQKGRQLE